MSILRKLLVAAVAALMLSSVFLFGCKKAETTEESTTATESSEESKMEEAGTEESKMEEAGIEEGGEEGGEEEESAE